MEDKKKFRENRLRQTLKIHTNSQSVSNFRPSAAKLIYEKFGEKKQLMTAMFDIPSERVVQVKNPYKPGEDGAEKGDAGTKEGLLYLTVTGNNITLTMNAKTEDDTPAATETITITVE